jgi:hypothetical protein
MKPIELTPKQCAKYLQFLGECSTKIFHDKNGNVIGEGYYHPSTEITLNSKNNTEMEGIIIDTPPKA